MVYFKSIWHWLVHCRVSQVLGCTLEHKLGTQLIVQLLRCVFPTWIRSIIVKIIIELDFIHLLLNVLSSTLSVLTLLILHYIK